MLDSTCSSTDAGSIAKSPSGTNSTHPSFHRPTEAHTPVNKRVELMHKNKLLNQQRIAYSNRAEAGLKKKSVAPTSILVLIASGEEGTQ